MWDDETKYNEINIIAFGWVRMNEIIKFTKPFLLLQAIIRGFSERKYMSKVYMKHVTLNANM